MIHYLRKIELTKQNALKIHIFGWILFIFYDAFIGGIVKGSFGTFGNYLVHYAINISLFYFHALYLLPLALRSATHSLWRLPVLIVLELLLYECIVYGVDTFLLSYTNILDLNGLNFDKTFVLAYIWRGLYFMLFSTGYYLFRQYKSERDEKEDIKLEYLETQLKKESLEKRMAEAKTAFLLAQINPHFLFNTLNFIYYTTAKTSSEGAASILLLSKIMRYSSDIENARELILLSKEAEYVEWLIEIHQIRFKENFQFSFTCTPQAKKWKIIPFLLITVAENMFKHGVTSDEKHPATLSIIEDEKANLIITSKNKTKALRDHNGLSSGLANLRERMELQYGRLATIFYHENADGYFNLRIEVTNIKSS